MAENRQLTDEEIAAVVGGIDFQFNEKNEIYLDFPSQVDSFGLDGWYSTTKLENLANTFVFFASKINPYINDDMRAAVIELYKRNGKSQAQIPANVKAITGIK